VLTKPSSEKVAVTHLARQGFETYLPRLQKKVLKGARWTERVAALFPRYVFVRLDVRSQALAPVRSTRGVSGLVRFGEEAAVVPDGVIDTLVRRADPDTGLHHLANSRPKPGAPVSVVSGPFAGLEGIFERESGEARAIILLSLLGQSTPVCVNSAFVVAA
jgi:transcriptional antiterminator RfaH